MSPASAMALLAALAATPGEDDLSFADPGPGPAPAALPDAWARTTAVTPYAPTLSVAQADTAFVEVELRLTRPLPERVRVVALDVQAPRGLWVAPWVALAAHAPGQAKVRYAVRASEAPGAQLALRMALEVRGEDDAAAGRVEVTQTVTVVAPTLGLPQVAADRAAFLALQAEARRAADALPELKDYLRLDRVDRPPALRRVPREKDAEVTRFWEHRLRADVARTRLRHAADAPDPALADAAARAIGALSDGPTGPAARARAIEGVTTDQALALARQALEALQVDEAEGFLDKLRASGRLDAAELAEALALLGAVHSLRGRDALAARAYGGALCLAPALTCTLARPALQARFRAAASQPACPGGLAVAQVSARLAAGDAGPELVVDAALAPDPHRVISGGELQLWGFGGSMDKARQVRVELQAGTPHLVATFPAEAEAEVALVKVLAKDVSGVVVARYGDPDPAAVPIAAPQGVGAQVPRWVWWVAAGAAVVGGAAALGAWAAGRDTGPTRGIGPIDVRF